MQIQEKTIYKIWLFWKLCRLVKTRIDYIVTRENLVYGTESNPAISLSLNSFCLRNS